MPSELWEPTEATLEFVETALRNHSRVTELVARTSHVFEVTTTGRKRPLVVLVVDLYTVGQADVVKAMDAVKDLDVLVTASTYNGYTRAAKTYATQNRIGLFQISEFLGALWKKRAMWNYVKHDKDGKPVTRFHD